MKTLIIGDYHCKPHLLKQYDIAIKKVQPDKLVFLGDYFDEWSIDPYLKPKLVEELYLWSQQYKNLEIEFLIGNHDYAYISPYANCSGHSYEIGDLAKNLLVNKLKVKMAAQVDNYLLTHAGLNNYWKNTYLKEQNDIASIVMKLNNMLQDAIEFVGVDNTTFNLRRKIAQYQYDNPDIALYEMPLFALNMVGPARLGSDHYSGPLWADRSELLENPLCGINQIVGHTPVKTCENIVSFDNESIWFCDTFSTYYQQSTLVPYGDQSMLLVENNKCNIIQAEIE